MGLLIEEAWFPKLAGFKVSQTLAELRKTILDGTSQESGPVGIYCSGF